MLVPGSWILDTGCLILDVWFLILDSGLSSIQRPGSSICNKYKMNRLHHIDNFFVDVAALSD